tara:strand:+ start:74 stop:655 length:582 start_codon:yes stop_codon:yes gene_type:complete
MILLEVLVLIGSSILVGMWINDPSGNYEPLIIGLSLVFIALEVYRRNKGSRQNVNTRDVKLFETYKDNVFDSGLIKVYEQHDFQSPLHRTTWLSLCQLVETGDGVEYQFSDEKLNSVYMKAYKSAFHFGSLISKYTVPMAPPMDDHISVYGVGYKEKPIKPDEKKQAIEINESGKAFVEAQKAFVVLGNRLLY